MAARCKIFDVGKERIGFVNSVAWMVAEPAFSVRFSERENPSIC